MPLVRLRRWALAVVLACAASGACALPPATFETPPGMPPAGGQAATPASPAGPRVGGRLIAPDGRPLITAAVVLSPLGGAVPAALDDVSLRPDGLFEFRNVPPGQYQIRARAQTQPSGPLLHATFTITVADRDLRHIDMTLAPGSRVAGRIVAAATTDPPPFDRLRIRAPLTDGSSFGEAAGADVSADGRFAIADLMSGIHTLVVEGLAEPWIVASITHRGRDISDSGFETRARLDLDDVRVTITDVASEIAGLVLDGSGAGVPGALVVAVPPGPQFWSPTSRRIGVVEADGGGRYRIRGLPSGEYRLMARTDLDPAAVYEREALAAIARAGVPVTVRGADARQIDLRVGPDSGWQTGRRP